MLFRKHRILSFLSCSVQKRLCEMKLRQRIRTGTFDNCESALEIFILDVINAQVRVHVLSYATRCTVHLGTQLLCFLRSCCWTHGDQRRTGATSPSPKQVDLAKKSLYLRSGFHDELCRIRRYPQRLKLCLRA